MLCGLDVAAVFVGGDRANDNWSRKMARTAGFVLRSDDVR